MDALSRANVEFCLDVFKELNYNHAGDNVFFSPLSLLYALSVILLGARGNSAGQMEKVLGAAGVLGGLGVFLRRTYTSTPRKRCHLVKEEPHVGKAYFLGLMA